MESYARLKTAIVTLTAAAVLALAPGALAKGGWSFVPFSAVKVFIEINDTDGDAGLQLFLDAEGWDRVTVYNPFGKPIVHFRARDGVAKQGITELAFESAEPSFDVQPLDEFLGLFPEGYYFFSGRTVEGDRLYGFALFTHDLPDAPLLTGPFEDDELEPGEVTVSWEPVTSPEGIEIVNYQVIVSRDDPHRTLAIDVRPEVTELELPEAFLEPDTEYSYEVIAEEASGNKTISEGEFTTGGEEDEDD